MGKYKNDAISENSSIDIALQTCNKNLYEPTIRPCARNDSYKKLLTTLSLLGTLIYYRRILLKSIYLTIKERLNKLSA